MTAVHLQPFAVKRCACSCNGYSVVDRVTHRCVGTFESLWDAQKIAVAWNKHKHVPPGEQVTCPDCTGLVAVLA